jgi:hypothetical protein
VLYSGPHQSTHTPISSGLRSVIRYLNWIVSKNSSKSDPLCRSSISYHAGLLEWGVLNPPANPPSKRIIPCRLSSTAYSVYSQLLYISVGRLFHVQLEDVPCPLETATRKFKPGTGSTLKYFIVPRWSSLRQSRIKAFIIHIKNVLSYKTGYSIEYKACIDSRSR